MACHPQHSQKLAKSHHCQTAQAIQRHHSTHACFLAPIRLWDTHQYQTLLTPRCSCKMAETLGKLISDSASMPLLCYSWFWHKQHFLRLLLWLVVCFHLYLWAMFSPLTGKLWHVMKQCPKKLKCKKLALVVPFLKMNHIMFMEVLSPKLYDIWWTLQFICLSLQCPWYSDHWAKWQINLVFQNFSSDTHNTFTVRFFPKPSQVMVSQNAITLSWQ